MNLQLQIAWRNVKPSEAAEAWIVKETEELDRLFDRATTCRVTLELPHRSSLRGRLFHVRIDLAAPGEEIVDTRDAAACQAHDELQAAIRDAFKALRRRLEDEARRRGGQGKGGELPSRGEVAWIFPLEGYGLISTWDDREVYFERSSVEGDAFDELEVGRRVSFAEERDERGLRAARVRPVS